MGIDTWPDVRRSGGVGEKSARMDHVVGSRMVRENHVVAKPAMVPRQILARPGFNLSISIQAKG